LCADYFPWNTVKFIFRSVFIAIYSIFLDTLIKAVSNYSIKCFMREKGQYTYLQCIHHKILELVEATIYSCSSLPFQKRLCYLVIEHTLYFINQHRQLLQAYLPSSVKSFAPRFCISQRAWSIVHHKVNC